MKSPSIKPTRSSGVTLLELTVIVSVILMLISVLFVGAASYKEGSDRSQCILNIRNTQLAVRSYQNIWGLNTGEDIDSDMLFDETDGFLPSKPECPKLGTYTYSTKIPDIGGLALTCSLAEDSQHKPANYHGW